MLIAAGGWLSMDPAALIVGKHGRGLASMLDRSYNIQTRAKNFSVAFEVLMVYSGRRKPMLLTGVQSLKVKPINPLAQARKGPRRN